MGSSSGRQRCRGAVDLLELTVKETLEAAGALRGEFNPFIYRMPAIGVSLFHHAVTTETTSLCWSWGKIQ
eukprot:3400204-Amphidinium_carterae.1